jgi:putative ABC transport system ATP-binding protein
VRAYGSLTPALLAANGLVKEYKLGGMTVRAVNNVTVDIRSGEFVAIMGASGSGKSTFMNMLGALDTPTSGTVLIDGHDIGSMSADELAQLRNETIGFVFQQFNLLPRTSALDNVRMPLLYARNRMKNDEADTRCRECLDMVGLSDRMGNHPSQLSGGQQQRVAIARALVNHPKLILADEPTGALDSKTSEDVMGLFTELNGMGITVVLVTHEHDVAAYARRQIMFKDGIILEDRS